MTDVGVVEDRNQYPVEENEATEEIHLRPPGSCQRICNPRDLSPVKCQNPHPQPSVDPEELIDYDVIRSDPAYPGEHRQCGEQVSYKRYVRISGT